MKDYKAETALLTVTDGSISASSDSGTPDAFTVAPNAANVPPTFFSQQPTLTERNTTITTRLVSRSRSSINGATRDPGTTSAS